MRSNMAAGVAMAGGSQYFDVRSAIPGLVIRKVWRENDPMHSKRLHAIAAALRAAKKGDGDD